MGMQEFITQDGSPTVYNEEYQEFYHSKSGAIEEVNEKYVKPCMIPELAKKGHLRLLDVGFGLGYCVIAAIDGAIGSNPECEIEVTSFEKDESFIERVKRLSPALPHYRILSSLEFDPKTRSYLYEDKSIYLRIRMGDAVETVKTLTGEYDAVFHCPFSPAKNRELWSVGFFSEIMRHMRHGAILSTYSYARKVRDNLREAGFTVSDGPTVGRRSPCTLAVPLQL
jgi:tRNA U34 5-methylaminomethyl-2-thiouridine-forming methyltransferase MnmC